MKEQSWIKVHTGLTNDPEHRSRMGVRVWLFMWLVDRADWETGIVCGFTDGWAGSEMHIPERTIEDQRQTLQTSGYITCHAGDQCQHIRIMRWRNPHLVNPPQINVPNDPTTWPEIPKGYGKFRTLSTESSVPLPAESSVPLHYDQILDQSSSEATGWIKQSYISVFGELPMPIEDTLLTDMEGVYAPCDVVRAFEDTKQADVKKRSEKKGRIDRKAAYANGILMDRSRDAGDSGETIMVDPWSGKQYAVPRQQT